MEQTGQLVADGAATAELVSAHLGHPQLVQFDAVRALFVQTGLPPEPQVYDLFWRYAGGQEHQITRALDEALAAGPIDMAKIKSVRAESCGEVGAEAIAEMVETARLQTDRLSQQLREGQADLLSYGRVIADGDAALLDAARPGAAPATASELAALIQPLGAATSVMMASNQKMEAELEKAIAETAVLRDQLRQAENAAVTDALTGLLNRRGLLDALESAQSMAVDTGETLTVAMVDIDHFKRVNDQWGHALGDEVLRFVAAHLAAGVGEGGKVGRIGGEEFVAVLPGLGIDQATVTIDRIRAALASQIIRRTSDGVSMGRISFSAGVSRNHHEDSSESVISRADAALYTAKRLGRDRVIPDRN